jgi:hypothetical protein
MWVVRMCWCSADERAQLKRSRELKAEHALKRAKQAAELERKARAKLEMLSKVGDSTSRGCR